MRKYLRHIAKVNMKRAGLRKICKHERAGDSYFANHWREYV